MSAKMSESFKDGEVTQSIKRTETPTMLSDPKGYLY